jgi:hypothetical protein
MKEHEDCFLCTLAKKIGRRKCGTIREKITKQMQKVVNSHARSIRQAALDRGVSKEDYVELIHHTAFNAVVELLVDTVLSFGINPMVAMATFMRIYNHMSSNTPFVIIPIPMGGAPEEEGDKTRDAAKKEPPPVNKRLN